MNKEENDIIGLSEEEVQKKVLEGKSNIPIENPSKTVKEIIKENVLTYFNLVFLIIASLLILVGSFRDLTFLPIIIANTLIGIIQEIRSKKIIDELTILNAPTANVLREGTLKSLPIETLVLEDIVLFKAGDQICADAVIVKGEVSVNESLLTGEEDEIQKKVNAELLSGSSSI